MVRQPARPRNIFVSVNGTSANLTIQNGGTLTNTGSIFGIGTAAGGVGTLTVTGAGSQWILSGSTLGVGKRLRQNRHTSTLKIARR